MFPRAKPTRVLARGLCLIQGLCMSLRCERGWVLCLRSDQSSWQIHARVVITYCLWQLLYHFSTVDLDDPA